MKFNLTPKKKTDFLKKSGKIICRSTSSGITLVEVLIAAFLSVFVIGGAAFGLMTMMQRNARLEDRSQTRMNLSRALNYIADEIKRANKVEIVRSGSSLPGSGTGVLLLTIPNESAANRNRVYFIRSLESYDKDKRVWWRGPNTINRYKGTVSNPVTAIPANGDDVLVDGITAPDATELARIQGLCDTGLQGADGFYACINEATNTADLYLYGRIKDDPTLPIFPLSIKVSARAFPRSPSPSPSPSSPSPSPSPT